MILSETLKNELVNMTKWADDEDKNRINNFLHLWTFKTPTFALKKIQKM
jgi:hypothetical protein